MQVFISWSGDRSREIADAIRTWLPKVIQSVKPWMSDQDISVGSRWLTEVATTLNHSNLGLICVTPENQHNPWLLFEAGALSKTLDQTCVCPLVFEMTPGQLVGPLTQFQANSLDRTGIGKILSTINNGLGERRIDPQQLEEILDVWWPKLHERLSAIQTKSSLQATRSTEDQLEEILLLVREQLRRENIRLEGSKERDEKLDSMLSFMDKLGGTLSNVLGQAQRIQSNFSSVSERMLSDSTISSVEGETKINEMKDEMRRVSGLINSSNIDLPSLQGLVSSLRDMQESDKKRHEKMISPPRDNETD